MTDGVAGGSPIHILAIDDDAAILALYRDLLGEEGFRTTLRRRLPADPAEVLELRPNLILLDLMLGGEESGYRFLARLKADVRATEIPVIVCTAAARLLDEVAGELAAWDCGVVLKPFDIDHLLAEIRSRLHHLGFGQAAS